MRVLYLSQYFPPEIGATQTRAYEMARGLVQAGHHVTMIAEVPNHPRGVIPPEYRGKIYERAELDGIEVIRVWVKTSPVKTLRTRLAFYLSYMFMAILAGIFLSRGKYNLVYATSPPLFVGAASLIISYLRRTPLIFEVRDLWPESAVTVGELNNSHFIKWATYLEEVCYRQAKYIIVTAQEIADRLIERGVPSEKVTLIRNGANIELFKRDMQAGQRTRCKLGLNDKFVILYAGLHGLAYDLEGVLEVVSNLQGELDIQFLFVGDGPTKAQMQQRSQMLKLKNIIFLTSQSRETIPDFFNAADVSIVPMKEPHIIGTLPIKIYDSMACEVPVIVSAVGEVRTIVEKNECGIVTAPYDYTQLRQAILQMRQDPELRRKLGRNGRRVVVEKYSRQAQARQLVHLLEQVANTIASASPSRQ